MSWSPADAQLLTHHDLGFLAGVKLAGVSAGAQVDIMMLIMRAASEAHRRASSLARSRPPAPPSP